MPNQASRHTTQPTTPHPPGGPLFWIGLVLGASFVAFGLIGIWLDRTDTHPVELVGWLGSAGVVHDAMLAPIVVGLAWLTGRLPPSSRTPVRLGLAMSALVTAIAWPLVRRWGAAASNPSLLPLDYTRNLISVLTGIWVVVGAATLFRTLSRGRDHGRNRDGDP
jgi:hypothetical protein